MFKQTFSIALMAIILGSCSQEYIPIESNNSDIGESLKNPYRISLKQALKTSDKLFRQLGDAKTRASFRTLGDVSFIVNEKTRSNVNTADTMFYIVNFANDQGFAVLSADKRLDPVYAISETGSLNESDTVENPALSVFFRQMRAEAAGVADSTAFGGDIIIGDEDPDYGYGDGCYKYGPILSKRPTFLTDKTIGKMANISPDSVSVISYLAIFNACVNRWPQSYNGQLYDWDILNSNLDFNPFELYLLGSEVNPNPEPEPDIDPSIIAEAQKNSMTADEFNKLLMEIWHSYARISLDLAPPITAAFQDHIPSPFVDGGNGSDYTPSDHWTKIFRDVMKFWGYHFENDQFILFPFDTESVKSIILKKSLVAVCAESDKYDFQNVWALDGWWSYGKHLDKGGKIPVIDGDEDIQLFHCVWPTNRNNNGWFKISYSGIDTRPTATEYGEQSNILEPKSKIKFLNNRAIPNK